MASIRKEIVIAAAPEKVWDAARDVGALHTRLVPGFVIDTVLEPGARLVTFADGSVLRELIVDIDDAGRRVVWSVVGAPFAHHIGSLQVFADSAAGGSGTRAVWIADLLPNDLAPTVAGLMEQGLAVMKRTLEASA